MCYVIARPNFARDEGGCITARPHCDLALQTLTSVGHRFRHILLAY
jgi:hypothetical protein